MFAYCSNNPIIYTDSTGYMYVGLLNGNPETIPDMGGGGYAHTPSNPITPDLKEEVQKRVEKDIQSVIDFYTTSPYIQRPLGSKNVYDGCIMIRNGLLMITTPWPTLTDEVHGAIMVFWGFKDVIEGIDQFF